MLLAVHLDSSGIRWQRPLGIVPSLVHHKEAGRWGSRAFGGPLITAGGLVFVAGTQDDMIRAFDTDTGEEMWSDHLPAGGQAAPMTYRYRGTQYLVIAAGGRSGIGSPGDWMVAWRLRD
jgi:quinoprotein glucose dehydrogenase